MAAPFDDQLIVDVEETVTYTNLAGSSNSVAGVTVDESAVSTVFSGHLSLVSRDADITIGRTQQATRPQEGGSITAADGTVYTIVSVLKRSLGYFWEIVGRSFNVPGGLTDEGTLSRRDNTATTDAKLSDPTWSNYVTAAACLMMTEEQAVDFNTDTRVDTLYAARVVMAGYREIRAGDRFVDTAEPTVYWTVDSAEPYDESFGAQVFRVTRRK